MDEARSGRSDGRITIRTIWASQSNARRNCMSHTTPICYELLGLCHVTSPLCLAWPPAPVYQHDRRRCKQARNACLRRENQSGWRGRDSPVGGRAISDFTLGEGSPNR
jgi:hypothetical protein